MGTTTVNLYLGGWHVSRQVLTLLRHVDMTRKEADENRG